MSDAPAIRSGKYEFLGLSHIPQDGAVLVPGSLTTDSLQALEKQLGGREISYINDAAATYDPGLEDKIASSSQEVISLSEAGFEDRIAAAVAAGQLAVFVPPKTIAHVATACRIPSPNLNALGATGANTVPITVNDNAEKRFAIDSGGSDPDVVFAVQEPIRGDELSAAKIREKLLLGSEQGFVRRNLLDRHLAEVLVRGLKAFSGRASILDGNDGSELGYDKFLAAAIVLAGYIKKQTDKPRIGIVLPPGKGGFLANAAALIAGKVPVNLNFTAGMDAINSAIKQADLDKFITADPFVRKMPNFPWPPNRDLILLERELPKLKSKVILRVILNKFIPAGALVRSLGIPKEGGDNEAALLFTSGSSGDPKGELLTHRNVLANVLQFGCRLGFEKEDKVLGCLPLFHSFGFTVTQWYPLIEGLSVVTNPSPLETQKIAGLIQEHRVSLFLATPTFLRGYLRRVKKEELAPLKIVVTGAEKLPAQLAAAFKKRFGKDVHEGYGLTETSPAASVCLPEMDDDGFGAQIIPSSRSGSVGQLLPGLAIRITNPDSEDDEPQDIDQTGMIWLRGPNVFPGYLDAPEKTKEVFDKDGWFRTGDIGRVDEDGFLYIEGRLSRFSKIAGEMVPHETLEDIIVKVMGLENEDERKIVVMGIPDEKKGEVTVLLSTVSPDTLSQEVIDLRYKLIDMDVPSLWTPKFIYPVDEIPALASGKLDLKACQMMTMEAKDKFSDYYGN